MLFKLPNVTLVAVCSPDYKNVQDNAIKKSCESIEFGEVLSIVSDEITSSDEYSRFMLYNLTNYIKTDYALVIQYDGYVLRPDLWTDEFLNYDYIGALWIPNTHFTAEGVEIRVGNGGFSLRSKKLLNAFNELGLEFTDGGKGFAHEDGQICNYYRKQLEDYGIKFAPVELAAKFSREQKCPETLTETFGFHKHL